MVRSFLSEIFIVFLPKYLRSSIFTFIRKITIDLPIQNVTYAKGYLYKMLPIQNVTYTKSYLYQMLPRQSVLDEMLLYENVLYETLLIHKKVKKLKHIFG